MKIKGQVRYRANFEVEIDISEKDFEALSDRKMNELIESHIDFGSVDFFETEIEDEIDY